MKTLDLRIDETEIVPGCAQKTAYIVVVQNTTGPKDEIRLSAECRATQEVEYWADLLIRELQKIKKKAKNINSN